MTEHTALDSFIVRIYRVDMEDPRKTAGLAESTDGFGKQEPFTDMATLAAILKRWEMTEEKNKAHRPFS
jgi:hypothetical protein